MSGMLETKIRAPGRPVVKVTSACSNWAPKVATGVIPDSEDAQTSFAPIRTVTYSVPRETAAAIWPFRSAMSAPVVAWLYDRPAIAGVAESPSAETTASRNARRVFVVPPWD